MENEFVPLSYSELVATKKMNDSCGFEVHRSACSAERVRNFICCTADLRNEKVSVTDMGAKIEAEIRFSAIACEISEDGEISFSSVKLDFPYSKDVNLDCHLDGNMRFECNSRISSADIELDGDMIYPRCTISSYISVLRENSTSCLASSFATDEIYTTDKSCVQVYFPKEKDTLFDIAKRYHTTVARIASVNALTEECVAASSAELLGIKRLIIK